MPIEATRDVFQAIADPTRRQIIDLLSVEAMTPNDIADKFPISRPAISQHLKHLIECDIVEVEQKGRNRYCKIKPHNLIPAFLWLEKYQQQWVSRIDNFERHIKKLSIKNKKK